MTDQMETPTRDDRPAAYMEDGVAIYRASAVGLCPEALVALRMGVQPALAPEWMLEKFEEGAEWEEFIVNEAVSMYGLDLISTQDSARLDITPTIAIRGSTDGQATDPAQPDLPNVGIEAKKLGPALFANWKRGLDAFWAASPYYRDQLTVYMEALQIPFIYAVGEWDPEKKKVVAVHTELIEQPPGDIQAIKNKILMVEGRARKGDLGSCDGTHSFPCPVYFLHEEKERAAVEQDQATTLERLGRAYYEAQQMESRGKKLKDGVKKELMETLGEYGFVDQESDLVVEPEVVNGVKVTPYVRRSSRLDKDAMKADGIDLDKYTSETKSIALRVSVKDD